MKNILVTGATGFLGSHVTNSLISNGHVVHIVSRKPLPPADNVHFRHTEDLFSANKEELSFLLNGIDTVVHLAWNVDPADYQHSDENWRSLSGSLRFALAARDSGIQHFVGIGTCIEYEKTELVRTPSTAIDPTTAYGAAKASLYLALREIFRGTTTTFTWCRIFFIYGEGEHPSRLHPFVRSQISEGVFPLLKNPQAIRDYLEVSEAGKRVARAAEREEPGVFNICSGKPKTVIEIASEIAEEMGRLDLVKETTKPALRNALGSSDRIVGLPSKELEDSEDL